MIYKNLVNNAINEIDSEAEKIYYTLLQNIANHTIKYRKMNNITNKDLADSLGITTSLISRIESGNKNISIKTIAKLLAKTNSEIIIREKQ